MELAKVEKGDVKATVVVADGKVKLVGKLDTAGVDVDVAVAVELGYFLDELAKQIPGTIDDAIIAAIKLAVKA